MSINKQTKVHTTNYVDTFIEVADDTKKNCGTPPPSKDKITIAEMQYALVKKNPYKYTSDDVLFQVFAERNGLTKSEYNQARKEFFSKGQPCFRASPLTKTYGFGVHSDSNGKIAIYGMDNPAYQKFLDDKKVTKVKAMKSGK